MQIHICIYVVRSLLKCPQAGTEGGVGVAFSRAQGSPPLARPHLASQVRSQALLFIKRMYEKEQLREYVEKFALNYLQLLVHPNPPSVLFGADKDTGVGRLPQAPWQPLAQQQELDLGTSGDRNEGLGGRRDPRPGKIAIALTLSNMAGPPQQNIIFHGHVRKAFWGRHRLCNPAG